jgi:hypothetical protein
MQVLIALIAALTAGVFYFAKRWRESQAEVGRLELQVASLKRQLVKHGRR